MDTKQRDSAKANLNAALQEEGQALSIARDAADAGGATSKQAVDAMRSAQAAHARSNAAAGELRALSAEIDRAYSVGNVPTGSGQPSELRRAPISKPTV